MSRIASSLLVAALVVFAGCAGGIGGLNDSQASDSGTVAFYVSDERNAIDQFSHLNVTVTKVAFAGDADANATAAADASSGANATADGAGADGAAEADGDADAEADSEAGLVTRDVEDRTVDLTALQGSNATLLGNISVPEGEYEKVFVHVGEVNGALQNGESVNVKLPSEKLHVSKNFEASSTSNVDFVFDITVFQTGNSGKFILKPVASESGTDVEIDVVGGSGAAANVAAEANAGADAALDVRVLGNASAGENATVKVTQQGEAVADAELRAGDEVVATTNANGTATVRVPADGELELGATANASGDGEDALLEGELELELGGEAGGEAGADEADSGEGGDADGESDSSASADLAVALDGSLTADEQATVVVTDGGGNAVENATVAVDGTVVGHTNADGELTFDVPADVSMDSELTVAADGEQVTLQAGTVAAAN